MKAVILAAGKGSRLRSISSSIPKPLIPFRNKPLLQHNIELCTKYGIDCLFINTHHLSEQITSFLGDGRRFGVSVTYSYEPELLGTSGALRNFEHELRNGPFYVIYGDNYSDCDLSTLKMANELRNALGTIAFHRREDTRESGVAEFDVDWKIKRFLEKPKPGETDSRWVNAGIYYFRPQILDFIPSGSSDFGRYIFPMLLQNNVPLYGVCKDISVRSFDTPEMLRRSMESLD